MIFLEAQTFRPLRRLAPDTSVSRKIASFHSLKLARFHAKVRQGSEPRRLSRTQFQDTRKLKRKEEKQVQRRETFQNRYEFKGVILRKLKLSPEEKLKYDTEFRNNVTIIRTLFFDRSYFMKILGFQTNASDLISVHRNLPVTSDEDEVVSVLDFALDSRDLSVEDRFQFSIRKLEDLEELGSDVAMLASGAYGGALSDGKSLEHPSVTVFSGKRAPLNKE
uniref:Uncharacterized protein n=1 Tax=Ditylenchus dipsaci TaxID=166011 RepID=A0A915EMZ4_9BILA